jgi:hypothetical protein
MKEFFDENGTKHLLFNYIEPESNNKGSKSKLKLQIVRSNTLNIKGLCVFFVRNSISIEITNINISQVNILCSTIKYFYQKKCQIF